MLCLGGPEGENYDGVLRLLDVLLSHETDEAEKRKILQEDYDIQMTKAMETEVSVMCNLSKGVLEKGFTKGMNEGRAQGREEGRTNGILDSLKNLMRTTGFTIETQIREMRIGLWHQFRHVVLHIRPRLTGLRNLCCR